MNRRQKEQAARQLQIQTWLSKPLGEFFNLPSSVYEIRQSWRKEKIKN